MMSPRFYIFICTVKIILLFKFLFLENLYAIDESQEKKKPIENHYSIATNTKNPQRVELKFHDIFSKKQLETLNSGFTTYSQITLFKNKGDAKSQKNPIMSSVCTIKYDLWEENYSLTQFANEPNVFLVNSIDHFINKCFTFDLDLATGLLTTQKEIFALLQIEQISQSQAEKVKEWLVKQQSKMIQGLFSHMLGNLTFKDTTLIAIKIRQ